MEILNQTIKIGHTTFTIASIISGAILLLITILLARMVKKIFAKRIYPLYTKENVGTPKSYLRIITYLIVITGTLISLEAAGVNITLLLAGSAALLVGIGFGIQNIANNFISGIILLIERPVKEGDFIEVDGILGTVTAVSARSTKLKTNSGVAIIVPNSKLLENKVINRSYNIVTEIEIALNIAYGEDMNLITEILLKCAQKNTDVVEEPPPSVSLTEFRESFMTVKLFFNIKDQKKYAVIRSQINRIIYEEFKNAGIKFAADRLNVSINKF